MIKHDDRKKNSSAEMQHVLKPVSFRFPAGPVQPHPVRSIPDPSFLPNPVFRSCFAAYNQK